MLLSLAVLLCGCPARRAQRENAAPAAPVPIDACSLLSAAEFEQILGAAPVGTNSVKLEQRRFLVAQCFVTLPAAKDSVNVEILQRAAGPEGRDPREEWQAIFHKQEKPRVRRDGSPKPPPAREPVAGVGDEAFWSGHQMGGTLHVLKGAWSLRINIGGPNDPGPTLEKLKALAQLLIARIEREMQTAR